MCIKKIKLCWFSLNGSQLGDQLKNINLTDVFVFTFEQSIQCNDFTVFVFFLNHCLRVKFPKLTQNVYNFPNPMGPRSCTKKDSDSPEYNILYMYNWFVQNPFMFPVNQTLPRNNNSDKKPRMYMGKEPHAVSLPIPTAWWGLNGITHYLDL